jgi:hypothetical protein
VTFEGVEMLNIRNSEDHHKDRGLCEGEEVARECIVAEE